LTSDYPHLELHAAIDKPGGEIIGKSVGSDFDQPSLKYSDSIEAGVRGVDSVIDFSIPESTERLVEVLLDSPKPTAICTTGLSQKTLSRIEELGQKTPVLVASNTSLGVFAQRRLVSMAAKILGEKFDIEIVESHHRNKKDAPSGTALTLAEDICRHRDLKVITERRELSLSRNKNQLGISSVRGGDTVGEHTVYFIAHGERLEITHRAFSRDIFARGVLELITILHDQKSGIYNPAELFCLLSPDLSDK
jgi:4-hydroxy-tetrahydrodipicolinate reductase